MPKNEPGRTRSRRGATEHAQPPHKRAQASPSSATKRKIPKVASHGSQRKRRSSAPGIESEILFAMSSLTSAPHNVPARTWCPRSPRSRRADARTKHFRTPLPALTGDRVDECTWSGPEAAFNSPSRQGLHSSSHLLDLAFRVVIVGRGSDQIRQMPSFAVDRRAAGRRHGYVYGALGEAGGTGRPSSPTPRQRY